MSEHKLEGAPARFLKAVTRAARCVGRLQDPEAIISVTLILMLAMLFIWIGL